MRNTLLTTTALVLSAGIASADGHATITWSGSATAGVARDGEVAAVLKSKTGAAAGAAAIADTDDTADSTNAATKVGTSTNAITTAALYQANLLAQVKANLAAMEEILDDTDNTGQSTTLTAGTSVTLLRTDIKNLRATAALGLADAGSASVDIAAQVVELNEDAAKLDAWFGVAKTATGDFKSYSEVNATVTAAVSLDNGMTVTAAMSVDAGTGYTFASDKTFDTAKTNGVALDNITLDTGTMGTIKLDSNAVAHLVDGDDDEAADVLYTNTIGSVTVNAAFDLNKDADATAVKGSTKVAWVAGVDNAGSALDVAGYTKTTIVTGVAADVQWSAKLSMPVSGGTAYVAMDEEGGNAFGASTTLSGLGLTFDSKLEALEEEISADRSNTVGLSYVMGATTLGASWNSIEDGDQWGITAAYAGDGMTIAASTDEGSDWSVSGTVTVGSGATVVGGVNYTEDAYLGLSFAF